MTDKEIKDLLNSDYGRGRTPLIIASKNQKLDLVRRLIDAGADVKYKDDNGETALTEAIVGLNTFGFSKNFRDYFYKMGKSYDSIPESQKLELVRALIDAKAIVNHKTEMNVTPISYAVGGGYLTIVEELIKKIDNTDILDQEDFFEETALMIAVRKGHIPLIETLINAGATVNYLTKNDITALTFTFQLFNFYTHQKKEESDDLKLEIMDVLIDLGADVNLKDSHGNTPLMIAATKNQTVIIKKLLDRGADPKIRKGNCDFWDFLKFKKTKEWVFKYIDGFEEYKIGVRPGL